VSQWNKGTAKNEATKVAGNNTTVTTTNVFIDEESRLLAVASVLEGIFGERDVEVCVALCDEVEQLFRCQRVCDICETKGQKAEF
jgi:hypothetical protein